MIKVKGQIGFTLDFEEELNMNEEQWDALNEREQMENICGNLSRNDYDDMECDSIDVWDLDEVESETSGEDLEANNPENMDKRWEAAIANARFFAKLYSEIPTGIFALSMTIRPAIERYERGERSDELLELLESIE